MCFRKQKKYGFLHPLWYRLLNQRIGSQRAKQYRVDSMFSPLNLDTILYGSQSMSADQVRREFRERRKHPRMPVHWTVYLYGKSDTHPVESVTVNLSSDGFFCCVPNPIQIGELLECTLIIPSHGSPDPNDLLSLRGIAQVVRLESVGSGYGIGCQIREYNIATISVQRIHLHNMTEANPCMS